MPKGDMPLLGAHTSIAGGLDRAFFRGREAGCKVIQIFTRNANRWNSEPLSAGQIDAFHRAREETAIEAVAAHDSYLINLASPRRDLRERSFNALLEEIRRAEALAIPFLVMHPGSHRGAGEDTGLRWVSGALNRIYECRPSSRVRILLETTAGQGTSLGYCFEHLAEIMAQTDVRERLGVCVDTCHIFAAGYDFRAPKAYAELINRFDSTVGMDQLKLLHINDAKKGLGSRVDRHEHPGYGLIGKEALSFFLRDPNFKRLPFLIETPKGVDEKGLDWDLKNLRTLRHLMEEDNRDDSV